MSANRVTSASLSLTLPISCQICLGKVKEPVVCPNQHVFCSPCLDLWLRSNRYCPTCRTPINHEQPCKKILGSIDLQVNSDSITKAELRKTRLELIRKEYEDDLSALHNTIERLKVENKRLHERLSEQDKTISALHLSLSQQGKEDGGSKPPTPDLDMLLRLTSKLQEASITYEQLKTDMTKTSQENKKLKEDNENLLRETARLKDESLFTKSPQRFSHYSMTAMQTKITQYEKEIQQLKKALTRSDVYIDELNSKLEGRTFNGLGRTPTDTNQRHTTQLMNGSRRSSSVSLEGTNTNDQTTSQPANNTNNDNGVHDDTVTDYDRPTMVNVTSFQSISSGMTTISQASTDMLSTPLEDAANAIETANHWLKAASSKSESSSGINPPDVFYPGSELAPHRLDAKFSTPVHTGVERFPASRQLMMLSERISRQKESTARIESLHGSPSPPSSDGGKVVPKTLDFSDMMGESSSLNGDSPRVLTPRLDRLSPSVMSYDASSSLTAMASCVYSKVKSENQDGSDLTIQAKRIKLEKEEALGFQ